MIDCESDRGGTEEDVGEVGGRGREREGGEGGEGRGDDELGGVFLGVLEEGELGREGGEKEEKREKPPQERKERIFWHLGWKVFCRCYP